MALPSEHGGWALLLEPALAGLVAAPSAAGAWLALAALGAFLTRHPLQLALGDRRRGRRYPRTSVAEHFVLGYGLLTLSCGSMALISAGHTFWPALLLAIPPGLIQLGYDLRRRGRDLPAELAGALALICLAPAIAMAGGAGPGPGLALGGLLAGRALPAILYIRARLRQARGQPAGPGAALAAHAAALLLSAGLALAGLTAWWVSIAFGLLLARAAWGLAPTTPPTPALRIGLQELALGIGCAALCGAGLP